MTAPNRAPPEDLPAMPVGAMGDALDSKIVRDLDAALGRAPAQGKLIGLLKRASRALSAHDYKTAAAAALRAVDVDAENPIACHMLAIALDKGGYLPEALEMYERALARAPRDPQIYLNLGLLAWRMGMLPSAERLFSTAQKVRPGWLPAIINQANCLRDQGRHDDSIELLRAAVTVHPEEPDLWNALAAVAVELGLLEEPIAFLHETLRLNPAYAKAHHNLGHALVEADRPEEALPHYAAALEGLTAPGERAESQHSTALALLSCGRLTEGWQAYASRLDPAYANSTRFLTEKLPLWAGEPLEGKRLLLLGEQGLGDEVLFASVIPELVAATGPRGRLVVACQPRLAALFRRSFPGAEVVPHSTIKSGHAVLRGALEAGPLNQFDAYAPFATAAGLVRPSVEAFPAENAFLRPDPARVAHWRAWLASLGPGRKVGLTWTSMLATGRRARAYSPFSAWGELLKTPGLGFVSLQYTDPTEALALARERFGVTVHVPPEINLRNDLDDLCALCAALDLVFGPMNATTNLAAGAGVETWLLARLRTAWVTLGTPGLPWYPSARLFAKDALGPWEPIIAEAAGALRAWAG